jgi:YVTN family beta-propeller protein
VFQRFLLATILAILAATPLAAEDKPRYAGPTADGFLLPNGWTISPVGKQVPLTDMPLNIVPLADSKRALVATSGFNQHDLVLVDLASAAVMERQTVAQSWFGLVLTPNQEKIWWSGGGAGLHSFALKQGKLSLVKVPESGPAAGQGSPPGKPSHPKTFASGLALDSRQQILYTLDMEASTITARDLKGSHPVRTGKIGGRPYDVVLARNGSHLYVSDWAGRAVLVLDPDSFRVLARIAVGEHPNQLALHPQDDRLFVACASSNCVSVIDTRRGIVSETIMTALFPRSPEGSTPDAVAVAPDGKSLYVANADNNCVAVIDIAKPNESQVKGFIPTGWYPTAVAVTPDGKTLLVGVGKGNQTRSNPPARRELPVKAGPRFLNFPYIGTTLSGALSIVPVPGDKQLAGYTATVYRNCPYAASQMAAAPYFHKTALPTRVGDPSPIRHVIYIIKENRTYDQVFGDLPQGNGDPSLVMFGERVTPNHHKLATEFVLLDNLYCNGQVSRDGHPWSTMAYNTDYIARDWTLTYSGRKGVDDDDEGNLSRAPSGYLWDACARNGLSYRSYGEYGRRVSEPDGTFRMEGAVPGLVGHMCPNYGTIRGKTGWARDPDNVETFLQEFRTFERNGKIPRFMIMSLGEDHTQGTRPGAPTPEACVASNDLALGRLVEGVSHSRSWPQTAIFVIEDDAQNGPDHVDAHRTVGLVISPYTRRHFVDSAQYSTVSLLRTIELILGLPPLSQYDAAAHPMFATFTDKPDLAPYQHDPAQIDLKAVNLQTAYGAARSAAMDFSEYDRINDFELNEILWRSIKGPKAPLPPAVRRALAFRPEMLANDSKRENPR